MIQHVTARVFGASALGVACFAGADALLKFLSGTHAAATVMTALYIAASGFVLLWLLCRRTGDDLKVKSAVCVFVHALLQALGIFCIVIAVKFLPLTEFTILTLTGPLFMVLMGRIILGERLSRRQYIAVLLGFIGALVVLAPASALITDAPMDWPLFAILAVVAYAAVDAGTAVFTRRFCREESTYALTLYDCLGVIACGLPFAWQEVAGLSVNDWRLFAGAGFLEMLGTFLFTVAALSGPIGPAGPVRYTQVIWAGLFGWVFFHEQPTFWTIAGCLLVVLSGYFLYERRGKQDPLT